MAIELDPSTLNVVISILGFFIFTYGAISVKIKSVWYLGEALPAVVFGAILGQMGARWLEPRMWGMAIVGQVPDITLGMTRLVIGIQLVIAGFQLPAQFLKFRWKEMAICLLPVMVIMWLATTACIIATVPKLTLLAALVIGSCVTCTDPILSQAVAKGPFSDKYVRRNLRELISAEAGANDGFGFPFLMLAVYLIRHAESPELTAEIAQNESLKEGVAEGVAEIARRAMSLVARASEGETESIGRLGGGVGQALGNWALETWLYTILMSAVYGTVMGVRQPCNSGTLYTDYYSWVACTLPVSRCAGDSVLPSSEWMLTGAGNGLTASHTCCCPSQLACLPSARAVCSLLTISLHVSLPELG